MTLGQSITIGGQDYAIRYRDSIVYEGRPVDFIIDHARLEVLTTVNNRLSLLEGVCDELGYRRPSQRAVPVIGAVD